MYFLNHFLSPDVHCKLDRHVQLDVRRHEILLVGFTEFHIFLSNGIHKLYKLIIMAMDMSMVKIEKRQFALTSCTFSNFLTFSIECM